VRLRGGFAEPPVEVSDEFRQVGLGRLDRPNVAQAQFADETILKGGPQSFDTAFGLGRARADIADGERVQDAAEMRRGLAPGELFLHGPVSVVADEEVQAIAIDGERQAVPGEDVAKEAGIAVNILGGAKLQGEDLRGGVIDGAEQNELGAARLEPREGTAVDLNQGAARGLRDAPASRLGRPPRALWWLPELLPHASHRFARQREAVLLTQLFGQVTVIEADVERGHEPHHGCAHAGGQPPGRRAATVAVHERGRAAGLEAALQTPHMADRDAEGGRDLRVLEPPATQPFQQPRPMQFLSAQREGLH